MIVRNYLLFKKLHCIYRGVWSNASFGACAGWFTILLSLFAIGGSNK